MRLRKGPIRRLGPSRFEVRLSGRERDAFRTFAAQLRELLTSEHPSSDPAVARLFPPALPDEDVLGNLEYEQQHGDELLLGKLESLDIVERTLERQELDERELLAWLGSINSIRLVVGTRLGVTEESSERDFAGDEQTSEMYALYGYLTWLEGWVVEALGEETPAAGSD
ncbi:MAG: DUF2017 domain-containing protein [Actinomycetota bacterium]|nr:DUF2017 domain-containing protein [Actinomycetota bacterium]MDH5223303.1 DUF2017 domain-containing protein [Actinomycetota bacterium]MDH5313341.1 DUF2017 domain-containing protein [Actinomycetota bacterium]